MCQIFRFYGFYQFLNFRCGKRQMLVDLEDVFIWNMLRNPMAWHPFW